MKMFAHVLGWLMVFLSAVDATSTSSPNWNLRGSNDNNERRTAEARIVGGSQAKLNKYPSYVRWSLGCGGLLIHDDLVLTAAHCTDTQYADTYPLYVGGNGRRMSGTRVYPESIHRHPLYNADLYHVYDFALIKLRQRFDDIEFIPLNTDPNIPVDQAKLTTVGHGLMEEDDQREDLPDVYQEVTVPYIQYCIPYNRQARQRSQFCAGDMPEGGKDACLGDSGSGIFLNDTSLLLVGLVSWGYGCARPHQPGIYARISAAERWIEHMKCQISDHPPDHCTPLQFTVTLNGFPETLRVSLVDDDDKSLTSYLKPDAIILPNDSFHGANADEDASYSYTLSVPKGRDYILKIQDTRSYGYSNSQRGGSVTVVDGESIYQLTGNFQGRETSVALPQVGGPALPVASSRIVDGP